jgi:hypothetical protein
LKMTLTIRDDRNVLEQTTVLMGDYKDRPIADLFPIIQRFLVRSRTIDNSAPIAVTSDQEGYAEATDILGQWLLPENDTIWVDNVNPQIKIRLGIDQFVWFLSRQEAERMNYSQLRTFIVEKFFSVTSSTLYLELACDGKGFDNEQDMRDNFNSKFTNEFAINLRGDYSETEAFLAALLVSIQTRPVSPLILETSVTNEFDMLRDETLQPVILRQPVSPSVVTSDTSIDINCPRLLAQDPTCVICQEDLFRKNCSDVRQIARCKHLFHASCLEQWLIGHETCPLCRLITSS